jgi:hypothetical protein
LDHRHLLPEEIDQLLDGEEGFGVAPLKAHIERCAQCRGELESQREVAYALERLPHFAPSSRLADRVMSNVQVFEPWHVAMADTIRRILPRSNVGRAFATATGGVMAVALTIMTVWLAHRADAVIFVANLVAQRTRGAIGDGLRETVTATVGESAASAVHAGGALGLAVAASIILAAVFVVAFGLKSLATVARRRRS